MLLPKAIQAVIYDYCNNHLPDEDWYVEEFEFIEDEKLRQRIIEEFRGIRFVYKLYEGIEADNENYIFEIRYPIFAYATIYEAVLHYVLYTYYADTIKFHDLQYHQVPAKISIPSAKLEQLNSLLEHNGETIITPADFRTLEHDGH